MAEASAAPMLEARGLPEAWVSLLTCLSMHVAADRFWVGKRQISSGATSVVASTSSRKRSDALVRVRSTVSPLCSQERNEATPGIGSEYSVSLRVKAPPRLEGGVSVAAVLQTSAAVSHSRVALFFASATARGPMPLSSSALRAWRLLGERAMPIFVLRPLSFELSRPLRLLCVDT